MIYNLKWSGEIAVEYMNIVKKLFAIIVLPLALSACVGSGTEPNKSATADMISQYRVSSMTVSVTPDVRVNELPRFANEPKEKTVSTLKAYVNSAMRKTVAPAFVGPRPVTIEAQITQVQFATNGGVILMQASSYMKGIVTMRDAKTREVLRTSRINIEDRPSFRGQGIFMVVAVAVNSSTTPEKRYASMTDKFAKEALALLK